MRLSAPSSGEGSAIGLFFRRLIIHVFSIVICRSGNCIGNPYCSTMMLSRSFPNAGIVCKSLYVLLLLSLLLRQVESNPREPNKDALGADSVVLITGAAGFLGSELALALYWTYKPRKIVLIDSMDKGFGSLGPSHPMGRRSEQDLALFELKRQRIFHVQQTLGPASAFYRVDLRPSIPEFFDTGEVPALASIFNEYPNITHVVHFADHYHRGSPNTDGEQVIPRIKNQPKAGMMEAMLEQVRLFTSKQNRQPHFVYASSSDVYNHRVNQTLTKTHTDDQNSFGQQALFSPPFLEDSPITTPSTVAGASKLLDEVMAQTYYDTEGIFSVGIRFFCIYGPWGLPGSPIFEVAERFANGYPLIDANDPLLDDIRDFLYIDDAIDVVMSAMQLRPRSESSRGGPRPIVINAGSGQGTTMRSIVQQIVNMYPGMQADTAERQPPTVSFASMARAQQLLGFQQQVSLQQGLEHVLAWHYDRAYPYGAKPTPGSLPATSHAISNKGIISCSRHDPECLRGTPVFPCASECAHELQCTPSFWDDVVEYTKALTSGCHAVLYTVELDERLTTLPSTVSTVSSKSKPFIESDANSNCNIAFVSQDSKLYKRLSSSMVSAARVVQHGSWRLIPVKISPQARNRHMHVLSMLPKLSPGQFFSIATRHAIYCDPDVVFKSVPRLLRETRFQPLSEEGLRGSTALLIGKRHVDDILPNRWNASRSQDQVQDHAYHTIRITLIDEMMGDGFCQLVDSSFVVHALASEDSRLFRCDVYGEAIQWDSSSDTSAFEFIIGLHDMWSRIGTRKEGHDPWWIGDNVKTVDQDGSIVKIKPDTSQDTQKTQRRLEESVDERIESWRRRLQTGATDDAAGAADDAILGDTEHNGFGLQGGEGFSFGSDKHKQQRHDTPKDDDIDLGDDYVQKIGNEKIPELKTPRDPSKYDIWMGMLSSESLHLFTRIVSMEDVGAIHVDNYEEVAYT